MSNNNAIFAARDAETMPTESWWADAHTQPRAHFYALVSANEGRMGVSKFGRMPVIANAERGVDLVAQLNQRKRLAERAI